MLVIFVSAIVADVVARVGSTLIQKISSAWNFNSELHDFVETLSTINAVLLDVEQRPTKSHQMKDWLRRINGVCDDAEDLLDELEYEDLRQQQQVGTHESFTTKVCRFISHSNPKFSSRMARKLEEIRKKLDKIVADKAGFHQMDGVEGGRLLHMERETHSFEPASNIFGRENDERKLIKHLMRTSYDENVSIIPIVGLAGIGKTTLARVVFNNEMVSGHFDKRIWVFVPLDFNIRKVMKDIINSAVDKNFGDAPLETMQALLRSSLTNQKFLLVLDDVWNVELAKWIEFKNLLMFGAIGSKIIVTTRDKRVAATVGTTSEHNLEFLNPRDCLSLFVSWAFKKGEEEDYPYLLEIGEEIVEKCEGIPLAVRTLGSLLYLTRDVQDWRKIKDSEIWKLEEHGILPALRLSYINLPSYLKKCFAFCSVFPKDYKFNSLELIRLWMAQGLLKSSDNNQELEEIGQQYIKELSWISFFQNVEEYGIVSTFEMHDLVHDLASSLVQTVSSENIYFQSDRHLSISGNPNKGKGSLPTQDNLRTIIFPVEGASNESFAKTCISRFKYLRVLDLRDSRFEVLPSSISNLKLLRYLNLYNSSIKKLPRSIFGLLSLQTLELSKCLELEELPTDIGKLINLRCLYITTKQVILPEEEIVCLKSLQFLGIVQCDNLRTLGERMQGLSTLKTLLIEDCKSLESLSCSMKYLTTLETLFIYNCEMLDLMKWEDSIEHLSLSLQSLWMACLPRLEALPQWLQGAAKTLKHICIGKCNNLTVLPDWLQNLKLFQKLVIEDCPKLSALPRGICSLHAHGELKIKNCHELSRRCKQKDWPKIAHVTKITIDEENFAEVGTSKSKND